MLFTANNSNNNKSNNDINDVVDAFEQFCGIGIEEVSNDEIRTIVQTLLEENMSDITTKRYRVVGGLLAMFRNHSRYHYYLLLFIYLFIYL